MIRLASESDDECNSESEESGEITTRRISRIIVMRMRTEGANLSARHDTCVAFVLVVNITKQCVHDNIRKYCLYGTPVDLCRTVSTSSTVQYSTAHESVSTHVPCRVIPSLTLAASSSFHTGMVLVFTASTDTEGWSQKRSRKDGT